MTQWYAFSCRADRTEAAANRLAQHMDCDAFAVCRTLRKRPPRKPARTVTECVLKSYIFAGFDRSPNFLAIEHMPGPRIYPLSFAGAIKPLNGMADLKWITGDLPKPLHRHYNIPRLRGQHVWTAGDHVEVESIGQVEVESVDGNQLKLALRLLGRPVIMRAEDAQLALRRVA